MKPYIIPVGGASPLGEWGYIEAFNEMIKQVLCMLCYTCITYMYSTSHKKVSRCTVSTIRYRQYYGP